MRDINQIFKDLPQLTVNIQQLTTGLTPTLATTATGKTLFRQTIKGAYELGLDVSVIFKFYISTSQVATLQNGDQIVAGSDRYKIIECELVDYARSITPFYELMVEKITI